MVGARRRGQKSPLDETHPEIARYWHPARNEELTPSDVTHRARREVWWRCGAGHVFSSPVFEQTLVGLRCRACHNEWLAERERIAASLVTDHPTLIAAWDSELPMDGLTVGECDGVQWLTADRPIRLRCPKGHKVGIGLLGYLDRGCPACRGQAKAKVYMSTSAPELVEQWHPARNRLRPDEVVDGSKKKVWWLTGCCDYEFEDSPANRQKGSQPWLCPRCETILNSLGRRDPELAAEWHPDNALTPFHVKPFTNYTATWRCSTDPAHVWTASLASRSAGTGCPKCSTAGTSKIEQEFAAEISKTHPGAQSARVGGWRVDVYVPDLSLVVEYDGSYWHGPQFPGRADVDLRKTQELVEAGYRIARIRERDLPLLDLSGPDLDPSLPKHVHQVRHHPITGSVEATAAAILGWATGLVEGGASPRT